VRAAIVDGVHVVADARDSDSATARFEELRLIGRDVDELADALPRHQKNTLRLFASTVD
jgi:hypothetical protein